MNAEEREPGLIRYLPIVLILAVLGVCLIGLYADRKELHPDKPKVYHVVTDAQAIVDDNSKDQCGWSFNGVTPNPCANDQGFSTFRKRRKSVPTTTTGTLGNVSMISGTGTSGFVALTSGTSITQATGGCVSPFTYDSHTKLCTTTLTFATTSNEVHCEKTVANQMICTYVPLDADHPDECKPGECLDGWAPEVQGYLCVKDGKEVKLNEPCGERQLKPAEFPKIASVHLVLDAVQARNQDHPVPQCTPESTTACFDPTIPHITNRLYSEKKNCEEWEGAACSQLDARDSGLWIPIGKPVLECKMPADIDVCPVVMMPAVPR